ncbi:MAG: hypothetical protein M1831_005593 [Alyxoria varia]|nr:MAG: hypothetical protein M1831_005593 [Alyxoria varia]
MSDDEYADYEDELAAFDEDEPGNDAGDREANNEGSVSPASSKNSPTRSRSKSPETNRMAEGRRHDGEDEDDAKNDSSGHSSPQSLGSGAMSESDEDISPSVPPTTSSDGPLFPLEGKFYNEKDRREILSMSEARREQLLAERAEQVEQSLFNRKLLERHNDAEKERLRGTMGIPKRKPTDDHDLTKQPPRKVNRKRAEANDRLDQYKRQRNEREEKRQSLSTRGGLKSSPFRDTGSAADSGSEDARGDFDDSPAPTHAPLASKSEPEPTLREFHLCQVGRSNFADYMFTPHFEDKVKGCYVRVNLGPNPRERGTFDYRMASIKDFVDGRPYQVEPQNGPRLTISRYILAEIGTQAKKFPFIACSNDRPTDREFNRYKVEMDNEKKPLPRPSLLKKKLDGLNSIINHVWTNEDVTERLKRSGALQREENDMKRNDARQMRQQAADAGRTDEVAHFTAKLRELGEDIANTSAKGSNPKLGQPSGLNKSINGSNGKQNGATDNTPQPEMTAAHRARIERIEANRRKAEAEEVKAAQLAAQRKAREEREAIKRGDTPTKADPFARVKTKPKLIYDLAPSKHSIATENGGDDLFGDDASSTVPTREVTPAVGEKKTNDTPEKPKNMMAAKLGIGHRKKNADFEVEDLGIEI